MSEHPSEQPLYTRYGFARTGEGNRPLTITPYPSICAGGTLRATVIASAIDLVGGLITRDIAGTDATFTSDLSLRIPAPGTPKKLITEARRLRDGKRLITTEVSLNFDSEDIDEQTSPNCYAYGQTTFARIPRSGSEELPLEHLSTPLEIESNPLQQPLDQEVGIEITSPAEGQVRLFVRPALLNPEGVLQGALVALLAESATLALANHAYQHRQLPTPQVITEMDLRYLAAASIGPMTTKATWLGQPEMRMLRVESRDQGNKNRLTSTALIRVQNQPDSSEIVD